MKFHPLLLLCTLLVIFSLCGTVSADDTKCVSISSNGTQSNGHSGEPFISADGRYVVFSSNANNLVSNDTNYYRDIFVRDLVSNVTERASISTNGEESNGDSFNPSISNDGRYVTYNSYANNLVPNDNNYFSDIFVYDRILKNTKRISISNTGEEIDGESFDASISSDGRYIVFTSYATNLIPNDNNNFVDIFLYNMSTGAIKRVSVTSTGEETNSNSYDPSISSDGRFIAFSSDANNYVKNDTNDCFDIFILDQNLNSIIRASISNTGEEGNGNSIQPSISVDGNFIVFTSYADNLSPNDENYRSDIFAYNQITKKIERVSTINGEEINENSHNPVISGNGRYVVFVVGYSQQVAKINKNLNLNFKNYEYANGQLFYHDMLFGTTKLISVSNDGEIANDYCDEPTINSDGSYVVYSSQANNLVGNDNNLNTDIFVYIKKSNQAPFSGIITPEIVKSGNTITIKAYSDDAIDVTAFIFNETFKLIKQADGKWILNYIVPSTPSGIYDVLLKATYVSGTFECFSLDFIVDNTLPTISGIITPNVTKSEDLIIINALSDSDTTSVWVSICGEYLEMHKNGENVWVLHYYVPIKPDGTYPVLLTAIDRIGNQGTQLLNLTIDNTPPSISASLYPETIHSFELLTITALSDSDTAGIKALIFNDIFELVKENDGTWSFNYTIPNMPDGVYDIFLTAIDNVGNQGLACKINFKIYNPVDNLPPAISATITPNPYKLIKGIFPRDTFITIKALSDPDTANIIALIFNQEFNMTRQSDGSWLLYYSVFGLKENIYHILLTAKDISGNIGTLATNFTVSNVHPAINATISPGKVKSGDTATIIVTSNPDAEKVYTRGIDGKLVNFIKQPDGTWRLDFIVPNVSDRTYTIWTTLIYGVGMNYRGYYTTIDEESSVYLTVDNTPPDIYGSISPNPVKSGDTLKINASCNTGYKNMADDTAYVKATVLDETFNMIKLPNKGSGSYWRTNYIIPQLSDGIYTIYLTTADLIGNYKTIRLNFTVDNTPPVITATITPDTLKFIDFANDRSVEIKAHSSTDTKAIYAFVGNSWRFLRYLNGYWIYKFGVPHIATLGIHNIILKAIDYAGNEATTSVSYYVYDNTGLGIGNSITGSSGSLDSSSGSNGDGGSSSESDSGSSTGSSKDSNGGSFSPGGNSADLMKALIFFIILLIILIAIGGLFLAVIVFPLEVALILIIIANIASFISIFTDLFDVFSFLYNLIYGNDLGGIIGGLLIILAIIGIFSLFLGPMVALILLIGGTLVFILVILALFSMAK